MNVFKSDLMVRFAVALHCSADDHHQTHNTPLLPPIWCLTALHPCGFFVGPQLLEAKRERRPAERQWIKSCLTVHKLVFQTANSAVNTISAKTAYYSTKILACSTSSYITSQTLFLVRLNPHFLRPRSILRISHRPFLIYLPAK